MKLNGFQVSGHGVTSRSSAPRRFTPAQASASLPLVQAIVQDIVESFHQAHDLHRRLHMLPEDAAPQAAQRLLQQRDSAVLRVHRLREELEALGCELKDMASGLVDFPAQRRGRPICLCWKLGEPRVGFWHDRDAGLTGRKPIREH